MEGIMEKQIVPELKVLEEKELALVAGGHGGGAIPPWPPVVKPLSGGGALPPWPPTERTKTNTSEQ